MSERLDDDASDAHRRGQIAAAAAVVYDEFFVPALFEQWAEPILDAVGVRPGDSVLDVGCGTGVAARQATERTGPGGTVIGLDPNDGMLAVARQRAPDIDWRRGPAEAIPLPDDHVDRTVCQFAAMFFQDGRSAIDEMIRVTRPGGRIAIATWASVDASPGYAAMVDLLREHVGDWAAEALLAPFSIGTEAELKELIERDGHPVTVETRRGIARFGSIDAWMHTDVRGWTLADRVDDETFDVVLRAARERLGEFTTADGSVQFPAPAVIGVIEI